MNIFILDEKPIAAAKMLCDKHIIKMITESAQMLSTAHRELDGFLAPVHGIFKHYNSEREFFVDVNGKPKLKPLKLLPRFDENIYFQSVYIANLTVYKSTHVNHPCNVWIRESPANYAWLYVHWLALMEEYAYRYERIHKSAELFKFLTKYPKNMPKVEEQTPYVLGFQDYPECVVEGDPIQSYRNFYMTKQNKMDMVWSKRKVPDWFKYE